MEPLFDNELTIDEGVLVEWQKREMATHYRMVYILYGALLVLCLALAGAALNMALSLGLALAWAMAAAFVVLFGVLLVTILTLPRRLVRGALKKNTDSGIPYRSAVAVYDDVLRVQRNRPKGEADQVTTRVLMEQVTALQGELQNTLRAAGDLTAADDEALAALRGRLLGMQQQMAVIQAAAPRAEAEQTRDWAELTGYLRSAGLHGLYFGEGVVLLGKDTFTLGDNAGFEALLERRLRAAAAAATDEKVKQELARTLARHWPDEQEARQ